MLQTAGEYIISGEDDQYEIATGLFCDFPYSINPRGIVNIAYARVT